MGNKKNEKPKSPEKDVVIGTCALCERPNVELKQSHIIPKLVYKRIKTFTDSKFRNFFDPRIVYQDGEKKYMLCGDCEQFFCVYETKFCNTFLDKFLRNPLGALPPPSDDIEFYILTVAWRVVYDDLFKCESYKDDEIHYEIFSELEQKLKRYIRQQYSKRSPQIISPELIEYIPDLKDKCLGERIAEIEKMQRSAVPEDMSEVKNYIFSLNDLGFSQDIIDLLDSMAIGYTFYSGKSLKYYVMTEYKGLVIATVYSRKRIVAIGFKGMLLNSKWNEKKRVRRDLMEEIVRMLQIMRERDAEAQKILDTNGLREKIEKRYRGRERQK